MADLIPEPPKGAAGWLDLLKKANDYNIVSLISAAIIGYAYWTAQDKWEKRLEASEARTRAALTACSNSVVGEGWKTREEVRKKARELRQAVTPDGSVP